MKFNCKNLWANVKKFMSRTCNLPLMMKAGQGRDTKRGMAKEGLTTIQVQRIKARNNGSEDTG